jgi:hypothetical protein
MVACLVEAVRETPFLPGYAVEVGLKAKAYLSTNTRRLELWNR